MQRRPMLFSMLAAFVFCMLLIASAAAQTVDGPRFEVASIKTNRQDPRARRHDRSCANGRFVFLGTYLDRLILWAWKIEDYQLVGAPTWATPSGSDVFDIEARLPPDTSESDCRLMTQTLLAERFHLKSHLATR